VSRARLPTDQLALSGTLGDHPGRYANRANEPATCGDLGKPPSYFTSTEKKIWKELAENVTPGWLTKSDRFSVELCVKLMAELRAGTIANQAKSALVTLLAKLGLNSSDRSRIQVAPAKIKPDDPFAEFGAK